jgi:hypothetical protein
MRLPQRRPIRAAETQGGHFLTQEKATLHVAIYRFLGAEFALIKVDAVTVRVCESLRLS